jgi:hypothetical protein
MNLIAQFLSTGKREVIADNGALLKLSNTIEQKEVVDFLIELSSSYLQNETLTSEWMNQSFDFTDKARKNLIQEAVYIHKTNSFFQKKDRLSQSTVIWMDRLLHFRWYEYRLKEGKSLPILGWTPFHDRVSTVPFSIFFVYLGVITSSPPLFPFILMVAYILFDNFWLQFKYLNQLVEISNDIADRVVATQNDTNEN